MNAQADQWTEPSRPGDCTDRFNAAARHDIGRPVAYYPRLAGLLGGVKAALLFCQLRYWQSRMTGGCGVHKTSDELCAETGLSYEEQRAARRVLKKAGVLIETEKRLEHRIYFRIDEEALGRLVEGSVAHPDETSSGCKNPIPRNGKSPFREVDFHQPANRSNPCSRTGQTPARERVDAHSVNGVKTTAEITAKSSSNACAHDPVDNFEAAAAALATDERPQPNPACSAEPSPQPTAQPRHDPGPDLLALLVSLETARRKVCLVNRNRNEAHQAAWVSRGVTADQLREAHRRAVAARERDGDRRAVNAGFLSRFIDEVLAEASGARGASLHADSAAWWLGGEAAVCAEGARLGVRPKRADESLPEYRVLVAKAAGKGPWIVHVLKDAQRPGYERIYRAIVNFMGKALLPDGHDLSLAAA